MKWVVDASAAAKWLAPEPESAQADTLLEHDLVVPDLVFAEVANILWKKQLRREMTSSDLAQWITVYGEAPKGKRDLCDPKAGSPAGSTGHRRHRLSQPAPSSAPTSAR